MKEARHALNISPTVKYSLLHHTDTDVVKRETKSECCYNFYFTHNQLWRLEQMQKKKKIFIMIIAVCVTEKAKPQRHGSSICFLLYWCQDHYVSNGVFNHVWAGQNKLTMGYVGVCVFLCMWTNTSPSCGQKENSCLCCSKKASHQTIQVTFYSSCHAFSLCKKNIN